MPDFDELPPVAAVQDSGAGGVPGNDQSGGSESFGGAGGAPSFVPNDLTTGAGGAPGSDGSGGHEGSDGGPHTQKLDFVANDGSLGLDLFSWLTGHDQERPKNLEEMAASAEKQRANGQVSEIDLVGHGSEGEQSTGKDDQPGGRITANMSDADREALARMGNTMTPGGEIVFNGCNVAAGDGTTMMSQAAAAAHHSVRGGTARQIPFLPGIEGPEVVVNPDGTSRVETNWAKDLYAWGDKHVPW